MSCPVSVYCDGVGVMSCVCILRWDRVSCSVSVYCAGVGVMSSVCIA